MIVIFPCLVSHPELDLAEHAPFAAKAQLCIHDKERDYIVADVQRDSIFYCCCYSKDMTRFSYVIDTESRSENSYPHNLYQVKACLNQQRTCS